MKIEKMIHLSLIERNIHVIHVIWFLCFLADWQIWRKVSRTKTRWIKWDPNINAKQKSTLQLLNNQDPPYCPLQNSKKFYIGYTCLLHGPSNFQKWSQVYRFLKTLTSVGTCSRFYFISFLFVWASQVIVGTKVVWKVNL